MDSGIPDPYNVVVCGHCREGCYKVCYYSHRHRFGCHNRSCPNNQPGTFYEEVQRDRPPRSQSRSQSQHRSQSRPRPRSGTEYYYSSRDEPSSSSRRSRRPSIVVIDTDYEESSGRARERRRRHRSSEYGYGAGDRAPSDQSYTERLRDRFSFGRQSGYDRQGGYDRQSGYDRHGGSSSRPRSENYYRYVDPNSYPEDPPRSSRRAPEGPRRTGSQSRRNQERDQQYESSRRRAESTSRGPARPTENAPQYIYAETTDPDGTVLDRNPDL